MAEIAANLQAVANAAEQNKKFATHCIKLRTTSQELYEVCQAVTSAQDLRNLTEQLNYAAASPGTLSQRERIAMLEGNWKGRAIDTLREAAARFEAHPSVLRAK